MHAPAGLLPIVRNADAAVGQSEAVPGGLLFFMTAAGFPISGIGISLRPYAAKPPAPIANAVPAAFVVRFSDLRTTELFPAFHPVQRAASPPTLAADRRRAQMRPGSSRRSEQAGHGNQ